MAKQHYNKKSGGKTGGAGKFIAALALSAVMLCGGVAVGYGAGTRWTYKRTEASTTLPSDIEATTMTLPNVVFGVDDNKPAGSEKSGVRKTVAPAAQAETEKAGQIDVTVNFTSELIEDSVLRELNVPIEWSFAWKKDVAGKNVNDYLTVTAHEDFTRTASLVMTQNFETAIIVTAKIKDSDKQTQMQVDCLTRLENPYAVDGPILNGTLKDFDNPESGTDFIEISLDAGEILKGSVAGQFRCNSMPFGLNYAFKEKLQAFVKFDLEFEEYYDLASQSTVTYSNAYPTSFTVHTPPLTYGMFITNWSELTGAQQNAVKYAWYKCCSYDDNAHFAILNFTYTYDGKDYYDVGLGTSLKLKISGEKNGKAVEGTLDMSLINNQVL